MTPKKNVVIKRTLVWIEKSELLSQLTLFSRECLRETISKISLLVYKENKTADGQYIKYVKKWIFHILF